MMVVSMNCSFKVPLGYFFVNGLPAANKAELINNALVILDSIGINKESITFDGLGSKALTTRRHTSAS